MPALRGNGKNNRNHSEVVMLINIGKGYAVKCDRCGYVPSNLCGSKAAITRAAKKNKWRIDSDGKTYCLGCQMMFQKEEQQKQVQ